MAKQVSPAEEVVKEINHNFFFKEFTFTDNALGGSGNEELADNIVWLDDILLLIQVKLRDAARQGTAEQEKKWFENKVINQAKSQIKDTLAYFEKYPALQLPNGRGFKVDLKAAPVAFSRRLILYQPGEQLAEAQRYRKFYVSREVGPVHLFQLEDYRQVCRHLVTPFEVNDYLGARERLLAQHGPALDKVPEQLVLGHYLSGDDVANFGPHHIDYLRRFRNDQDEFDMSGIIGRFFERQQSSAQPNDQYHYIIKELAKLHRSDLKLFKQRFMLALEKRTAQEQVLPYRMVAPHTGCGFIFIPLPAKSSADWQRDLLTFTFAHKYDQGLDKCIGIVFFDAPGGKGYIDIFWQLLASPWQREEAYEQLLGEHSLLREVRVETADRYHFD